MAVSNSTYDDQFYKNQMDRSYQSAKIFSHILATYFSPKSVIDVGCGRGTWLKAFAEIEAIRLVGVDGPWNSQEKMIDSIIAFHARDLSQSINIEGYGKFDLAISLEVAEHLSACAAEHFISSLTNFSDSILFGAACPGQGGIDHKNEQPASYWAKKFAKHGYVPFDLFRPVAWGNKDVPFWYQQNTYLYLRKGTEVYNSLVEDGKTQIENVEFMNCIHPLLLEQHLDRSLIRNIFYRICPTVLREVVLKARRVFFSPKS